MRIQTRIGVLWLGLSLAAASSSIAVTAPSPEPDDEPAVRLTPVASELGDQAIQRRVETRLEEEKLLHAAGPWVDVQQGIVTLEGKVAHVWARDQAIALALEQPDVVAVEDRLTIASAESDEELGRELAKQVRRYVFFTVFDDVNLSVEDGHVVLIGKVTQPYKRKELEERLQRVLGVQSLENELVVLDVSINDRQLRRALAYRIYGDPLFRPFASRVNPPVHIIVEDGRVLLRGAVRSKVEKAKAGHIARSTFGVFSVTNELSVDS